MHSRVSAGGSASATRRFQHPRGRRHRSHNAQRNARGSDFGRRCCCFLFLFGRFALGLAFLLFRQGAGLGAWRLRARIGGSGGASRASVTELARLAKLALVLFPKLARLVTRSAASAALSLIRFLLGPGRSLFPFAFAFSSFSHKGRITDTIVGRMARVQVFAFLATLTSTFLEVETDTLDELFCGPFFFALSFTLILALTLPAGNRPAEVSFATCCCPTSWYGTGKTAY